MISFAETPVPEQCPIEAMGFCFLAAAPASAQDVPHIEFAAYFIGFKKAEFGAVTIPLAMSKGQKPHSLRQVVGIMASYAVLHKCEFEEFYKRAYAGTGVGGTLPESFVRRKMQYAKEIHSRFLQFGLDPEKILLTSQS